MSNMVPCERASDLLLGLVGVLRRLAGWQICLGLAPLTVALYYGLVGLGAGTGALQVLVFASANLAACIGALLSARRHRALRPAMLLVAAGAAASVAADLYFYLAALVVGEVAYPSFADLGYLAVFPFMAAGLLVIVRRRTPEWDGVSGIDAAIVAVSAAFLTYVFLIAPAVALSQGWDVAELVSVAYPVGDLMLITVGARLILGAGPRAAALRLFGAYLALVLYADVMYGIQTLTGTYQVANHLDGVWMASGYALAAATLHPSLVRMVETSSVATPDATVGRLAVLAIAAALAPATQLAQYLRGQQPHIVVATLTCIALFLLVLTRMAGLVNAQRRAAITDGLTGLRTRRYLENALQAESERSARSGAPLGVLMLDIDHFKTVNDTFGHNGGDRVLIEVAHRIRQLIRPGDLVARYGGEEFAVVLPRADPTETLDVAERVRRGVAATPIAVGDGRLHHTTVSAGAAGMPHPCASLDELMLAADRALYAAKHAGRNRVTAAVSTAGPDGLQPAP